MHLQNLQLLITHLMPGTNTVPGIIYERHTMRFLQDALAILIWCSSICALYYIGMIFL